MTAMVSELEFRSVLGHFCTGVAVVTGHDGTAPAGFACQSFSAVSLDPPLVLFCPAKKSRTWPILAAAGHFAVNVLAGDQQEISAVFGARGADKFAQVPWTPSPSGAPLIEGALTWIDCDLEAVHDAGDHHVVIGRVTALGPPSDARPLLFHCGRYTVTEPAPDSLAALLSWPRPDDWL
ncbi:3-hydroxy-9,10-secoandrosta-1,3,5(10)-triene-9,17-dione monooxygenase reductase subunit [Amycolatopsis sp. H20-H5]|uniref:3-hydroxy-9,10-secoandrosta-1,3,5(10)-triene-9, 17-dione monooxygenase reductase subunit n=1 Tax=Amycolatopsis sp. H20-H5 TaxID=3046309 RepID=UPI002DB5EE1F|nr:3-hydroxy-9,10-secoandrosta-1,3,5(10)-triene-9,17-dione monooxygenase reductase subunit [Amycolatopsis sp. H20-H5]MEC3976444.1 flavin reductase family protein [Amycolatopsis sp. H20-H5]